MINIIDSVMGSGKTTFMINYIKENQDKRFFVVTPFLSEIERISKEVSFLKEPTKSSKNRKYQDLQNLVYNRNSIITTHAMFNKLSSKIIQEIKKAGYILIVDEVADVLNVWDFKTNSDKDNFFAHYGYVDDEGYLCWHNEKNPPESYEYQSAFFEEMHKCNNKTLLLHKGKTCIEQLAVSLFESFEEVYILTYMFNGSLQKSYFDLYNIEYKFLSLENGNLIDYKPLSIEERNKLKNLIIIIHNDKMNYIGKEKNALNVTWYNDNIPLKGKQSRKSKNLVKNLIDNATNFFTNKCNRAKVKNNLCSTFRNYEEKLNGSKWNKKFIAFNSRATNEFNHIENLAYLVNVYPNGDIVSFLASKGVRVNKEHYALSTLIQTIFRTRIRNFDKPDEERKINLYIPSSRMRNLLIKWLDNEIE